MFAKPRSVNNSGLMDCRPPLVNTSYTGINFVLLSLPLLWFYYTKKVNFFSSMFGVFVLLSNTRLSVTKCLSPSSNREDLFSNVFAH